MPQSPYLEDQSTTSYVLPHSPVRRARSALRDDALRESPGRAVVVLHPVPVRVRATAGLAIAYTVTHVLVESDGDGPYSVQWEPSWLVHRF
ncbi:hypothetical protein GA0061083_1668 [Pseudarthrobacter enclensis]|uniref:Uncharacterized protein n=1 Tax=Pseudarthrobacter enclensis TaxID=993070 RepID=A0A0V8ISN8_9MICC|nr:hypothetical protein [Pseudarthrobacter enclensis]KSU77763.1 hypothetical protein AS031_06755 [Pseudarthrobacter enclensis]SCB93917.1 hypothetical protein GA0061083_1668 [Pseudarthrobacter enclensis]